MSRIRNYIFDFDGTIMDTSAVILATIKATVASLGLPARTDDECRAIIGIRTDEAGHHLFPSRPVSDAVFAAEFRANYDRIKRSSVENAFPGVVPTLRILHALGRPLAIASSRRLASLGDYLDGLGIRSLFADIVGADSVTHGKPHPEPVLRILAGQGWDPRETLVVGDADVDILMANAAGCLSCAVTYGNGSPEALAAARPSFVVGSFPEILEL